MSTQVPEHDQLFSESEQENAATLSPERREGYLLWMLSHAPWWGVSLALHVLAILLVGLATWQTHARPQGPIIESVLQAPPRMLPVDLDPPRKEDRFKVLANDTPHEKAFDPQLPVSHIYVPPEIMAIAKVEKDFKTAGEHGEDNGGAFGREDSQLFTKPAGSINELAHGERLADLEVIGPALKDGPASVPTWGQPDGKLGLTDGGTYGNRGGNSRYVAVRMYNPDVWRGPRTGIDPTGPTDKALRWLAEHQESDGHWDSVKWGAQHKVDTGVTALALLALAGAGHTERTGTLRQTVRRAVEWLRSKQDQNGLIYDRTDRDHGGPGYAHAIAGLALAEAAGMGRQRATIEAAQKAVDYSLKEFCNQRDGWRYAPRQGGDLSVTGWFIMQLKSAKISGLYVPKEAFDQAMSYVDKYEVKDKLGPGVSAYSYSPGAAHITQATTSIGNLCRLFLGENPEKLRPGVEALVKRDGLPDAWDKSRTNLYYWYYGTLCVFQVDALGKRTPGPLWDSWNKAMKTTLVQNQRHDGDLNGSWDPVGQWSDRYGRVGQTAFGALCLEVYFRYALILR